MIAFVFAMPQEMAGVRGLDPVPTNGLPYHVRRGRLGSQEVVTVATGMGKQASARATAQAITEYQPTALVSMGFSGGTQPGLTTGELILCREVYCAPDVSCVPVQTAQGMRTSDGAEPVGADLGVCHRQGQHTKAISKEARYPTPPPKSPSIPLSQRGRIRGLPPWKGGTQGDSTLHRSNETAYEPDSTRSSLLTPSCLHSHATLLATATRAARAISCPWREGNGLTTDRMAVSAAEKAHLGSLYGAHAVDMESFWVGQVARERGAPFLAVRAILDPAEESVPDLNPFMTAEGSLLGGRAAAHFAIRPWHWPGFVRLGLGSQRAARNLGAWAAALAGEMDR